MAGTISWPAGFSIDPRTITHYLLDPRSRDGKPKAAFFTRHGFGSDAPDRLMQTLFQHTDLQNFTGITIASRGHKLAFEGPMPGPDGTGIRLQTVWQVDAGGDGVARFITAYPI